MNEMYRVWTSTYNSAVELRLQVVLQLISAAERLPPAA